MTSPISSSRQQGQTTKRPAKMASSPSLSHLLNFTLPPRQAQPPSLPRRSKKACTQQGVWNKERFVNAQYRFVMNPTGDYTAHFADPDIFFQWHDILQVLIPRSSALASVSSAGATYNEKEGLTTCPICLSPPTVPRLTKCGHVFCFPCILHYLSTSNNPKWARCPICFDSVNAKELKCVKWYDAPIHVEGDDQDDQELPPEGSSLAMAQSGLAGIPLTGSLLRMRLMQRPYITTLALPRSYTWPSDLIPPHQAPLHFLPDVYNYAKFMLATPDYLISDLLKDLNILAAERRMIVGFGDELSLSFMDAAEENLRHQIAKAAALETSQLKDAVDKAIRDQREIEDRFSLLVRRGQQEPSDLLEDIPEAFLAMQGNLGFNVGKDLMRLAPAWTTPDSTINLPHRSPAALNRDPKQRRNLNPPPPSTQTYYYYQGASGLPVFLHPLDIKILFSHFHSYSSFPDDITIRVESVSEGTVGDDLRKRCKYLAHMPEGADVVFVEADLEGIVGHEGLKNFEGLLKTRRARRSEKEKKDDRARARAEEREKDRIVASSSYNFSPMHTFIAPEESQESSELSPIPPQPVGTWGTRTFASALHATPSGMPMRTPSSSAQRTPRQGDDDGDMNIAWHEIEQRARGDGGRKRGSKRVVLGGNGGRRR
ncbi:hypothetical protein SERLA73DRAFT_173968 [Serpula lacrymans var. lacrymans S7.3]|uniref:RING-type domain-containing protein n=2 Tax=Serpula lacrymans var. lacrymans TaxID=341189 RepID=F8PGD0_SERL3|nr:uncharacterized protein SERLADRAFT_454952 [Serpula lacrymans var. lacrymans S7.9]EGO04837.1 hypothetical protein SERLA73DRAFT_173968 [Serpula lacrymans var. lacrymans S7.3]EGO30665.1 hypothetical protein SERLADRAFT_454952 [Serpula lacrymans var. lacrymans S7.9]